MLFSYKRFSAYPLLVVQIAIIIEMTKKLKGKCFQLEVLHTIHINIKYNPKLPGSSSDSYSYYKK